jgi:hypothetical protein
MVWLSSPVVRMHLVNPETGEYIVRDDLASGPTIVNEDEQYEYLSQVRHAAHLFPFRGIARREYATKACLANTTPASHCRCSRSDR